MSTQFSDFAPKNPIKSAQIIGDGVSVETYKAQPNGPLVKRGHPDYVLGGSDISEFDHCPHRWVSGYKDEGTKSTEWGTIVDCLLMGGEPDQFAICPETYTSLKKVKGSLDAVVEEKPWNFNAEVCREWKEERLAEGRMIVKHDVFESAFFAAELIMKDPQLAGIFKASRKQVFIEGIYEDRETGVSVPVKCLIDLVAPEMFLADFKTCQSAHPKPWARQVFNFGYHVQAARHLDLWNTATGEMRVEFRHYIQESYEPFEIGKRILSEEFVVLGRDRYLRSLKRYAQCIKTGVWPGYDVSKSNSDMVIDGHTLVSPEAWMVGE